MKLLNSVFPSSAVFSTKAMVTENALHAEKNDRRMIHAVVNMRRMSETTRLMRAQSLTHH